MFSCTCNSAYVENRQQILKNIIAFIIKTPINMCINLLYNKYSTILDCIISSSH